MEKNAAENANATLSPTIDFVFVAALQLRTSPVETQYKSEDETTEKSCEKLKMNAELTAAVMINQF